MLTAPVSLSKKDFENLRDQTVEFIKSFLDTVHKSPAEEIACLNDVPVMRQIARDAVEKKFKAEITEMESGEAAAQAAAQVLGQAKFDLIISDVQMPNGTGL